MNLSTERLQESRPAKFFFAIASGENKYLPEAEEMISKKCCPLGPRSELYRFSDFSDYYDSETGGEVWKYLVCAEGLMPPEEIVGIKLRVEEIQAQFLVKRDGRSCRGANIDPGYINGWQVVLATVKNFTQRIYLGKGVYAETTLLYQKGKFQSFPWTYADYESSLVKDFLKRARDEWRRQSES